MTNPQSQEKRYRRRYLLLLVPVLLLTIYVASQAGLRITRPDRLEVEVIPVSTADYSQWEPTVFNRVDPILGTLLAQQGTEGTPPLQVAVAATNTPTPPASNTPLPSATRTDLPEDEQTQTAVAEVTQTRTNTATATPTQTATATDTATPTLTRTATRTATRTPTQTRTATVTRTATRTVTLTRTSTAIPTATAQSGLLPTPRTTVTLRPSATITNTATLTLRPTQTAVPTSTPIVPTLRPTVDVITIPSQTPAVIVIPPATPIPAPTAFFTFAQASFTAPYTVSFSNQSTGDITGFSWNFGDGNISGEVSPAHGYGAPGTYTVTLTVTGPGGSNAYTQAVTVIAAPDLSLSMASSVTRVQEGSTVSFTITVTNNGAGTANSVTMSDSVLAELVYLSDSLGGAYNPASGVWSMGALASGESRSITLNFQVGTISNFGVPITRTASVASAEADANPGNNSASVNLLAVEINLSITKTVDNNAPTGGDNVTFTITVRNDGTRPATGVVVTDNLNPNLIYVSHTAGQSYDPGSGLWSVGTVGANGNTRQLQITVQVSPSVSETAINNTATITAFNQVNTSNNPRASINIFIQATDLRIALYTLDNPAPFIGSTLTYTLTVENLGPMDTGGVTVPNVIPASGVTYVSHAAPGTNYTPGGAWNVGTLAVGQSRTLTVQVRVDAPVGGVTAVPNTASVSANLSDPFQNNNSATVTFTIPTADLRITQAVDNPTPTVGANVTYSITVENLGPGVAGGVALNNPLPAGLSYVADSLGGAFSSGTWSIGTLGAGASGTINLVATVGTGSAPSNVITTSANVVTASYDPDLSNNLAVATLTLPIDLAITMSVNNTNPAVGQNITYTLTATNTSPFNTTGVAVLAPLPLGLSHVSNSGGYVPATGVWTVGTLNGGASSVLTITATVTTASAPSNIVISAATIGSTGSTDNNNANNSASVTVIIAIDLLVAIAIDNTSPMVNGIVNYLVAVSNLSPFDASGVTVSEALPTVLNVSVDNTSQGSKGAGIWTVGALPPGGSAQNVIAATVNNTATVGDSYSNQVVVSSSTTDPDSLNNAAVAVFTVAPQPSVDIDVDITTSNQYPAAGETVTLTVLATNLGTDTATNITISIAGNPWIIPSLASGANTSTTRGYTVPSGSPAGNLSPVTASLSSLDQADTNTANDSASITMTVPLELTITKTVDNPNAVAGATIEYTITVTNTNTVSAASSVVMTDVLPTELTYTGNSLPLNATFSGGTLTWNIGTLNAGASVVLRINATVNAVPSGTVITNTATVALAQYDNNLTNNEDDAIITVP